MQLLLLLLFLNLSLSVNGQDTIPPVRSRLVLKVAPLTLADPDRTLQIALEYGVGRRTSLQTEVGYGWQKLWSHSSYFRDVPAAEIWRIRNEFRWYTGHFRQNSRENIDVRAKAPLGNYVALDVLAKQINIIQPEAILTYKPAAGESVPPSYSVLGNMRTRLLAFAAHAVFGRQFVLFPANKSLNNRLLVDFYFGAGVRQVIVDEFRKQSDVKDAYYVNAPDFIFRFNQHRKLMPSFRAGFKLGFVL
jgi:hypothetical protein